MQIEIECLTIPCNLSTKTCMSTYILVRLGAFIALDIKGPAISIGIGATSYWFSPWSELLRRWFVCTGKWINVDQTWHFKISRFDHLSASMWSGCRSNLARSSSVRNIAVGANSWAEKRDRYRSIMKGVKSPNPTSHSWNNYLIMSITKGRQLK